MLPFLFAKQSSAKSEGKSVGGIRAHGPDLDLVLTYIMLRNPQKALKLKDPQTKTN